MRYLMLLLVLSVLLAVPVAGPLATPARAEDAPVFEAVLCQGWDAHVTPLGPTDAYLTDNASVRLVFWTKTAPAAGLRLTGVITDAKGIVILRGRPIVADGKATRWGTGFLLAGQPWSRAGGTFKFHLLRNDEKTPVVTKTFTIRAGKRWALLVGIADYPPAGKGGSDLPSTDKDAARMGDLLVESFGFQKDRITLVTNLDATSARIERELTLLATKAAPSDAVLFYYVGHGAQIPDLDGDEADGWDEALATADPRPALVTTRDQLKLYLSDDRLATLLGNFRTRNVTVIFDSCHSGTAVRAGEDEPEGEGLFRGMRERPGFGRKLVEAAEDAPRAEPTGVAAGLDIDQRYVFISAARSWETAMGGPNGGLFSAQLRAALRSSNGLSWDRIVAGLRPRVQRFNPGQAPEVMGASRRFPFSLAEARADAPYERPSVAVVGAFDPKAPSFLPTGLAGKHHAYVSGLASLIAEHRGITYDVYAAGSGLSGRPKGRVVLTGSLAELPRKGGSSLMYAGARIVSGSVTRGDRLVPRAVRVPAANPAVGVFLRKGTGSVFERLRASTRAVLGLLAKDRGLRIGKGGPQEMDYVVLPKMAGGKVVAAIYTPALFYVGSAAGTDGDIAKQIGEMVGARHATFSRVNRISNPSAPFRVRVTLEGGEGRRKSGETLEFRGYADRPAWLYVFAAVEGGPMQLVSSSSAALTPNKPFAFRVATREGLKGRMAVKVFASEKPIETSVLKSATGAARGAALLAALRKAHPAPDGASDLIATDGWADAILWVDMK